MPALGTHVFHAKECFLKIEPKLELDRDFVGACAISHDTMALMPGYYGTFVAAHEKNTEDYFLAEIRYIKAHGLRENPSAMAFLYGQIMHYALDTSTHPLIYYMTECHPAKFYVSALGAHTLFEAWYDVRLEEAEKAKDPAFNPKYAFVKRVCEGGIDAMIDAVYGETYGTKNASKGFRSGIKIWEIYQARLRGPMLRHAKKYYGDFEGMLNAEGGLFLHPVTNAPLDLTFAQAYEASFALARELIEAADANIYGGAANEAALTIAFGNSYDTGVDWKNSAKRYFLGYPPKK